MLMFVVNTVGIRASYFSSTLQMYCTHMTRRQQAGEK